MRSTITITAVVLVHAAVLTFIGCRTTTGFPEQSATGTTAYGVGYNPPSSTASVTTTAPATYTPPPTVTAPPPATQDFSRSDPTSETRLLIDSNSQQSGAAATAEGNRYKVKKNESLWLIARREGVSVKALQEANNMRDNEVLKEGRELIIPAKQGGSAVSASSAEAVTAGGDVYVVQKGDVLGTIARKHGTTVAKLKAANSLKSDMVRVGQKLRIPSDAVSPAPAAGNAPVAPSHRTPAATSGATTTPPPAVAPSTGLDIGDGFGDFRVTSPTATPPVAPTTTTTAVPPPSAPITTTTTPVDTPITLTR